MKTAVYLYCFLKSAKTPKLSRAPKGLPGAGKPRAIAVGTGLWAVVADAPLAKYDEEHIARGLEDLEWVSACAVGHEATVEAAAALGAVVPAKLFTIFLSDARLVAHAEREKKSIARVLARVDGCVELGVRVSFDEREALDAAETRARKTAKPSTGAGFLARKRELRDAAREIAVSARANVDEIHDALQAKAQEARRRAPVQQAAGPRLLLDAAYLVRIGRTDAFRRTVERLRSELGAGYDVVLTGPWPPYNFVSEAA